MKKLVLAIGCAMAMTGVAFAQGSVNWSAISFSAMTAGTNTSVSPLFGGSGAGGTYGVTATTANGFDYEMLYMPNSSVLGTAPTATSLFNGTWKDTTLGAVNAGSAGRLTATGNTVNNATVPWDTGTTDNIVMVGWSADLGTSWVGVSNILAKLAQGNNSLLLTQLAGQQGYFGVSTVGFINPLANGTAPGASVFGTAATSQGTPIFSLNTPLYFLPVPEPATLALAGLGGLSLLLFRRQRK